MIPYIFMLIVAAPDGTLQITPRVTLSATDCQRMIDTVAKKGEPHTIATCVPHGLGVEFKATSEYKPLS